MKMRSVRAELFRADGRTDRQTEKTKLTVAFRSVTNIIGGRNQAKPPSAGFCKLHGDIAHKTV